MAAKKCRINWYTVTNGTQRKTSATKVRKAMGAAYDFQVVDICRNGPTTIRVGGTRYFGTPAARSRPKARRSWKRKR